MWKLYVVSKLNCETLIYEKTENIIMKYKINLETGMKRAKSFPSDLSKQQDTGVLRNPWVNFNHCDGNKV